MIILKDYSLIFSLPLPLPFLESSSSLLNFQLPHSFLLHFALSYLSQICCFSLGSEDHPHLYHAFDSFVDHLGTRACKLSSRSYTWNCQHRHHSTACPWNFCSMNSSEVRVSKMARWTAAPFWIAGCDHYTWSGVTCGLLAHSYSLQARSLTEYSSWRALLLW